jgi:ABC-type transporter Mla subunit MlaD
MERDDVRVGLFVLVAGALLVAMTLWILGRGVLGDGGRQVEIRLPHSGGVRTGDRVRIAGVEAGRITAIRLAGDGELPVRVEVMLEGGHDIFEGAEAALTSDSLLGSTYLEIRPGPSTGAVLAADGFVSGEPRASLDTVFAQLGDLSVTADQTLIQLQQVVSDLSSAIEPTLERLQRVLSDRNLESVESLLAGADRTLDDLGTRLAETLERVDVLIEQVGAASEGVPEVASSLDELAQSLQNAIGPDGQRITELLETARMSLAGLDVGQGEVAALIGDLRETATSLQALSEELRARPAALLGLRAPQERSPGDRAGRKGDSP